MSKDIEKQLKNLKMNQYFLIKKDGIEFLGKKLRGKKVALAELNFEVIEE